LEGTISADEKAEFAAWYNSHDDRESTLPTSFVESEQALEARMYARVKASVNASAEHAIGNRKTWKWVFSAAALLLVGLSMGFYFWLYTADTMGHEAYDIAPGRNTAMLTLADGRSVELRETESGIVI